MNKYLWGQVLHARNYGATRYIYICSDIRAFALFDVELDY